VGSFEQRGCANPTSCAALLEPPTAEHACDISNERKQRLVYRVPHKLRQCKSEMALFLQIENDTPAAPWTLRVRSSAAQPLVSAAALLERTPPTSPRALAYLQKGRSTDLEHVAVSACPCPPRRFLLSVPSVCSCCRAGCRPATSPSRLFSTIAGLIDFL